jgi:hypothetical protein
MDEGRYLEVRDLLAKAGLTKVAAAEIFGVTETTVSGWSRDSNRPIPDDALILLRAAAMGVPLRVHEPVYPRLIKQAEQLAASGTKPATPEDAVAALLLEHRDDSVVAPLSTQLVATLELLAVQPWRWRRQLLAPARLDRPLVAIEWDGRGQLSGQRVLAIATRARGEAFSVRLVIEDCVRHRPLLAVPQKAEITPDGLKSLPAEDVAAEAAALLACGLPHDAANKPIWWLVQIALLALAQADITRSLP